MPVNPLPLVDRILGGRLREELTDRRLKGDSYATIARWLYEEHQVEAVGETVRRWCNELGIEKPEAASA